MTIDCVIYRCSKQDQMYLYLRAEAAPESLPEALRRMTGSLSQVMRLTIDQDRKLARAETATVLQKIAEQGYYLQMPPNGQINAKINFGGG